MVSFAANQSAEVLRHRAGKSDLEVIQQGVSWSSGRQIRTETAWR
jgi:hypothetical protein